MTQSHATELVVLLSLVLTTVVRSDRDLATKALVLIGERFPEVLFAHVVTSLELNDPYVPERMLAAAYGTTLSLVDSETAPTFRPLLGDLAKTLYRKMFGRRAPNATHHTLMRDYAMGIIEIDFYDVTGEPGTLYREAGNGWHGNRHSLLYVRADLLRRYLTETRQALVWCN